MSEKEKMVMAFEEDDIWGEPFSYVDFQGKLPEFDTALIDRDDIMRALEESASYVDEDIFEDGGPGMSGAYYKVYARDETTFKKALAERLLKIAQEVQ